MSARTSDHPVTYLLGAFLLFIISSLRPTIYDTTYYAFDCIVRIAFRPVVRLLTKSNILYATASADAFRRELVQHQLLGALFPILSPNDPKAESKS
jgi:hypothetical protein